MKLKELLDKYGDYEINDFNIEEAFTELNTNDDCCGICIKVKKPKPKTVWDLQEGDTWFELCRDGRIMEFNHNIGYNHHVVIQGNVFLTKEEAEKERERREVETLLLKHGGRRWFKQGEKNHYLWATDTGTGLILGTTCDLIQGAIYFDSKVELTEAVEQIGRDRIIKALFELRREDQ